MRLLSALLAFALAGAAAASAHAAPCAADQLSLAVDGENGNFNGMSHSGTLLVLRNLGPAACTVAGFPKILFTDAANATLPITRVVPRGMHPGPVVVPVTILPEAELTSSLRWVSGEVYPHSQCFVPAALVVVIGDQKLTTPLAAHICGRSGKVTYDMTRLVPDPTEASPSSQSRCPVIIQGVALPPG
jgi:hypothetical protein